MKNQILFNNQNQLFSNAIFNPKFVGILLLFVLWLSAGFAVKAQVPDNYVLPVKTKKYAKLANPLIRNNQPVDVTIVNGEVYLEGDISLGSEQFLDTFQNMQLSVTADPTLMSGRWEDGIVPFVILDGFTDSEREIIIKAMNHISENTNVCFRRRTNEGSYIKFKKYSVKELGFSGGQSKLGRCVFGCFDGQEIKLSAVDDGLVRHEIGHALGLAHEQSREDRDQFVEILRNNIKPGHEHNFNQNVFFSTDVGNYDFNSIMHYDAFAFGKKVDGQVKQTIKRRSNPSDTSFGTTSVLSNGDINGINSMYPTGQKCSPLPILARGELEVGQIKTVDIYAKELYNYTGIYMRQGQKFKFSVGANDMWQNGDREVNADGYNASVFDAARRHGDLKMMALVGEIFDRNNDPLAYSGTYFRIGTSRIWTATKTGFLVGIANDCMVCYGDNAWKVTVKVERIE